jgi:hypothetical protein
MTTLNNKASKIRFIGFALTLLGGCAETTAPVTAPVDAEQPSDTVTNPEDAGDAEDCGVLCDSAIDVEAPVDNCAADEQICDGACVQAATDALMELARRADHLQTEAQPRT